MQQRKLEDLPEWSEEKVCQLPHGFLLPLTEWEMEQLHLALNENQSCMAAISWFL